MIRQRRLYVVLAMVIVAAVSGARVDQRQGVPSSAAAKSPELPLMFEPSPTGAAYSVRARGYTMQVSAKGGTVQLGRDGNARRVALTFVGGAGELAPGQRFPTTVNYLQGPREQWRTGVPVYRDVRVRGVYRGIDAVFYGVDREVEYDLVVAPGS